MGVKTIDDCFRHAIKRARERYNVWFTHSDLTRMSQEIALNKAVHLLTESRTRTHWLIDDKYIAVYNKKLKAITTFLPPECIYNYLANTNTMTSKNNIL